ncbi:MAG: hypothetical protein AB7O97_13305 [Planctomycetota bacterium]
MLRTLRPAVLSLLALLPLGGCATILGTAVSPITGGVDLVRVAIPPRQWYFMPFVFLGGAVAGPFVAIYNGVNHDASIFKSWNGYWHRFDEVFRPFEMILDR